MRTTEASPLVAVTEPSLARRPLDALRPALVPFALAVLAFNPRTPTTSLPPLLSDVQRTLRAVGTRAGPVDGAAHPLHGAVRAAGGLAAMTFLVSYSAASVAPVVIGALHDTTGGYATPFGLLALLACVELAIATRLRPALGGSVR